MFLSGIKILLFLLILSLLFARTTDADMIVSREITMNEWSATTLEFSSRDTATGASTNLLFNVSGLKPGGFQVKAIRVQKDGKMNFDYVASTEIIGGDLAFCANLTITILENWQKKFSGKLSDLNIERKMTESGQNDWFFVISLDSNDSELKNKSCDFKFLFKTTGTGFKDEKSVENQISSGGW